MSAASANNVRLPEKKAPPISTTKEPVISASAIRRLLRSEFDGCSVVCGAVDVLIRFPLCQTHDSAMCLGDELETLWNDVTCVKDLTHTPALSWRGALGRGMLTVTIARREPLKWLRASAEGVVKLLLSHNET